MAARNAKGLLARRHGWDPAEVGVFHIEIGRASCRERVS
jgi:hypothetical protein